MPEVFGLLDEMPKWYDLGQRKYRESQLPYAVVRGAWKGTFQSNQNNVIISNHVVPAGQQLKLLFLRCWTEFPTGASFRVRTTAQTGDVGSAPHGNIDYPFVEAAGQDLTAGNLEGPVHVCEGSIDFMIQHAYAAGGYYYSISWWGVEAEDSQG